MIYEIKHRFTGGIIYSTKSGTFREAVEKAVALKVPLFGSDLSGSDLHRANLHAANLSEANLFGANLDFSCLPFWCGSFGVKVDSRLIRQLAAHICRLKCDEPEGQAIQRLLRPARNAFCRDRSDVREVE